MRLEGQEAKALCNTPEEYDPKNDDDTVMISTSVGEMREAPGQRVYHLGYDQDGHNSDDNSVSSDGWHTLLGYGANDRLVFERYLETAEAAGRPLGYLRMDGEPPRRFYKS